MGANAAREAQAVYLQCNSVTLRQPKEIKAIGDDVRRVQSVDQSPREFMRSGLRERQPPPKTVSDMSCQTIMEEPAAEPDSGFIAGMPGEGKDGYNALTVEEEEQRVETRGLCSQEMMDWHNNWLHSVECGELDIYTCLGLSNCFTFTDDTRKIIAKVVGCFILQLVIPCILLKVELEAGFSYRPLIPGMDFRTMGACLYLYSLYSMYNNALDECRSQCLQWAIDQNVTTGYWLPMMIGEITNVFVSLILVLTLFVIFVDVEHPADLILNAVAVNFLGAVDGEFVDDEMKQDALKNFKELFYEYGADVENKEERTHHDCLNIVLNILLTVVVISGLCLSMVFFFAPSPEHTETANIGKKGAYPKLI